MPATHRPGRELLAGEPWPLGAHICCDGTNFAVFSRHATILELLIFDRKQLSKPSFRVTLDSRRHRTGDIWHVRLPERLQGQCYAYRAIGPSGPKDASMASSY